MNLAALLQFLVGEAEQVVPMFVHNATSQRIEAVVITTASAVQGLLAAALAAAKAPPPTS